jgi:hypothetical protein
MRDEETATRLTARAMAAADEAGSAELRAYTMSLNLAYRSCTAGSSVTSR